MILHWRGVRRVAEIDCFCYFSCAFFVKKNKLSKCSESCHMKAGHLLTWVIHKQSHVYQHFWHRYLQFNASVTLFS